MSDEPSSPVCYAAQADDVYMGYAGRDELVRALTELLEAERAGARVSLASARQSAEPGHRDLMRTVRRDEARWCAMLTRHIKRLGHAPSRQVGDFYGKALAITDLRERLYFLNRGQRWVVKRLEILLPRVRDEGLHADLNAMLISHRLNIETAEAYLAGTGEAPA
ncbi:MULTISPECIES: DUF6306 domain-containing protein [unclassified Sphingomonas]|jgi:hypothetical protein|uniref:DUF6306 domain-containing protein n=1 Tax=unclassified Sphingomonas TaxID=196159 RepID=UPI0006FA424D|nr:MULTISPECIES: DUF6306 domain-containing protein [unclassified Sphingomonas]KQX24167.1 dioxygenase [Sphingomonas sp. Root1294]KQY69659.1 dioxygenase [Sphingomonas sp. Root50]KRB93468.1 dioxygenase [Sphingomonas sp. Root720]TXH82443.1 MAG: hypothetical protein E6Q77_06325 [Rhizobium sp.]